MTSRSFVAAVWRAGADDILVRHGKRFALQLVTYFDRPDMPPVATAIQEQRRRIGIDISVSVDLLSAIPAGHENGMLELALAHAFRRH